MLSNTYTDSTTATLTAHARQGLIKPAGVLRNNEKIAEYYDSYGHDTTFYWKMLYTNNPKTSCYHINIFVLTTYFDTRSKKEGLQHNDWENWSYRAMKVMQHIIIYIC